MNKMMNFFYKKQEERDNDFKSQQDEYVEKRKQESLSNDIQFDIKDFINEFIGKYDEQQPDSDQQWYQEAFEEFCNIEVEDQKAEKAPPKPEFDLDNFPSLDKTGKMYEPPKVKVSSKLSKKE